ncbi:uncharacterized protein LOC130622151 [Hydractinia symbiolongicarpus]|uniref:uncharacterized protein LOC130622151 n=1 Tax=Hydractinia symbiolongicarpus TaxID=13093 RepID=UPI00255111C8|nr:uncharacterized protein LOC130622151 [Hydractinia symbiolongicarpus]
MSYDYSDSLPAEAAKRYQEKLQSLGLEKCPYKLPADDWIDDPTEWPSLTYHHLYHYLIKTPRIFTPEAMENYKALEAYKCDEWFHPTCLKLKKLPTRKIWYCIDCRKLKKRKKDT